MEIRMYNKDLDCHVTIKPIAFISEIQDSYWKLVSLGFHPSHGEIPVSLTHTVCVLNCKSSSNSESMSDEKYIAFFLEKVKECGYFINANRYEFVRNNKGEGVEKQL